MYKDKTYETKSRHLEAKMCVTRPSYLLTENSHDIEWLLDEVDVYRFT